MEIKGKIARVFPKREGTSERGHWESQDFLVEYFWWPNQTEASKMLFTVMGAEKIANAKLQEGNEVTVRYYVEAHEHNGRWFNNVRCLGVKHKADEEAQAQTTQAQDPVMDAQGDDLPY